MCSVVERAFRASPHAGRKFYRLRNRQRATRHHIGRKMIPSAEIFDRHSEAVCHSDQGISSTHLVVLRMRFGGQGYGHYQLIALVQRVAFCEAVGLSDVCRARVQQRRNRIERLSGLYYVEAPTGALVDRNLFHARLKRPQRAGGDMKIERHILRRAHAQQARVQGDDLLQGSVGKIGN